jgi:hypothetical protein
VGSLGVTGGVTFGRAGAFFDSSLGFDLVGAGSEAEALGAAESAAASAALECFFLDF